MQERRTEDAFDFFPLILAFSLQGKGLYIRRCTAQEPGSTQHLSQRILLTSAPRHCRPAARMLG
jgi:hypothetical protein